MLWHKNIVPSSSYILQSDTTNLLDPTMHVNHVACIVESVWISYV